MVDQCTLELTSVRSEVGQCTLYQPWIPSRLLGPLPHMLSTLHRFLWFSTAPYGVYDSPNPELRNIPQVTSFVTDDLRGYDHEKYAIGEKGHERELAPLIDRSCAALGCSTNVFLKMGRCFSLMGLMRVSQVANS